MNEVQAIKADPHAWTHDGDMAETFGLAPNFGCCTANFNQGWPKFINQVVMETVAAGKGAAVTLLVPATATLADGSSVTINTSYPFSDSVQVSCKPKAAAFPLLIRVPSWATKATLNGKPVAAGAFAQQTCSPGGSNSFTLELAPEITVEEWAADQHGGAAPHPGYSVVRGPLLYSLPVEHNYTTYGRHFGSGDEASNDYFLRPTSPWNYALDIDLDDPTKTLTFAAGEPYSRGAAPFNRTGPFAIKASARLLPSWGLELNSAAPPPRSPACDDGGCGPPTELTLVPHGFTELRVGEFPLVRQLASTSRTAAATTQAPAVTPFPPQMDLFAAGDPMLPVAGSGGPARPIACYRLPVLLPVPNDTLIAFASARNWTGDGCHPKRPVVNNPSPGSGTLPQFLALRVSRDRGATWSPIRQAATHQFIDFQAVFDRTSGSIIVMSCYSPKGPYASSCFGGGNWIQTRSTDLGRTFSEPTPITPASPTALGPAAEQGLTPGPARALQLRTGKRAGRLLFCSHQNGIVDHHSGTIAPVFVSDDGGKTYRTTTVLPRGVPGDVKYGPDECSMIELSNGTIRLDGECSNGRLGLPTSDRRPLLRTTGRNNWYDQTKHYTRTYFLSTDQGETFGAQQFDDALSLDPTCPGSQLTMNGTAGPSLWLSGPVADPRSPDPWRARINMSLHHSTSDGGTWEPPVQVVSGPSGYNCLGNLGVAADGSGSGVGLLFEQSDERCEPCLPQFAHLPDCAERGLGAESCKITFVKWET